MDILISQQIVRRQLMLLMKTMILLSVLISAQEVGIHDMFLGELDMGVLIVRIIVSNW